ncbi:AsmA family protein [Pseudomonas syringae pv. actinidiae]|nr:AsmA family protein [Pseudomonas syringae pv. actinidiae]
MRSAIGRSRRLAGDSPLPEQPTKAAWSSAKLLPLERLRTLDVAADLSFGKLTLNKLPIGNAALRTQVSGGVIKLDTLSGDLYNGNFEVKGDLDARPDVRLRAYKRALPRCRSSAFSKARARRPLYAAC